MKRVVLSILMVFIFLAPLWAGEVYMWTDEKGVKHITETPPPKANIKAEVMKYKRDEPLEVNPSQEKQKTLKEEIRNQTEKDASEVNQQQRFMQIAPERRPEEQQTQEMRQEEQELERHRVKEEDRRVEERH